MISEQVGHNIKKDQYDNAEPVYSIWLMMSSPDYNANAVALFSHLEQHNLFESYIPEENAKDLTNIVFINLPKDRKKHEDKLNQLTGPLSAIFSDTMKPEEKMAELKHYGIQTTEEIKEKVNSMEHLSDNILLRGINQGISQGFNKGISQGISIGEKRGEENGTVKAKLETAERMIKADRYDDKEIADISGMKLEDVKNLKKQLLN